MQFTVESISILITYFTDRTRDRSWVTNKLKKSDRHIEKYLWFISLKLLENLRDRLSRDHLKSVIVLTIAPS
ncbi:MULTISPECIES: hypothetical protein [Planktothricoides]|uniref:Transposase n=2 Tax=Planktothricoides raciborskii TaxID=132608 RepID=A0AAU8J5Z4_9CYAN|nr:MULTISPECIES: hypothetical protein [Planktothricoides]KOR38348.1 hypothetical protein AM228_01930 [Planktothricoides sp. SR001]MBD2543419.1 hypothetical protein [Planktothricoides raciborskii FACHB-1370]MBD2581718.1 hypothetical protein [Planktothricoides raciborskii FACHB-1261]